MPDVPPRARMSIRALCRQEAIAMGPRKNSHHRATEVTEKREQMAYFRGMYLRGTESSHLVFLASIVNEETASSENREDSISRSDAGTRGDKRKVRT